MLTREAPTRKTLSFSHLWPPSKSCHDAEEARRRRRPHRRHRGDARQEDSVHQSIRERWRALKGFRAVGIGASMIGSHCARPAFATESLDTRTSESSKRLMRVPPGDQGKPHSPEAILHAEEIHGLHGWNEYFGAARTPSLAAPRKHDAARCALGFAARRRVPLRAPGPPRRGRRPPRLHDRASRPVGA